MHIADFGGSGAPLVLVHGLGGAHTNWMAVGGALAARNRVLAPDLLGFGRTPLAGRVPSVEENVALIGRLLDAEAREPAVLVGNSMGALVALLVAASRPDRVSRLILVGPALPRPFYAPIDPEVATLFTLYMMPGVAEYVLRRQIAKAGPERALRSMMRLCGLHPARIEPRVWEAALALAHERAGYAWAHDALLGSARSLILALTQRWKVEAAIRAVRAPTLVVQGSADRLVPLAVSRAALRLRPDWRLEVLEGVGHVPQLEVPERWVEVVTRWMTAA